LRSGGANIHERASSVKEKLESLVSEMIEKHILLDEAVGAFEKKFIQAALDGAARSHYIRSTEDIRNGLDSPSCPGGAIAAQSSLPGADVS
jgi:hypothetical protein